MSVSATGVRETALALLTTMSMPPNVCRGLVDAGLHGVFVAHVDDQRQGRPPAFSISSAAV